MFYFFVRVVGVISFSPNPSSALNIQDGGQAFSEEADSYPVAIYLFSK